jgi:4a-hydroxytetrahydrobiopterin dehydratase
MILFQTNLQDLSGWAREGEAIKKDYQFNNFNEVVQAVNRIAALAEDQHHHPDILMHGWNKLSIISSTHDANGITGRDFKLAAAIEKIVNP